MPLRNRKLDDKGLVLSAGSQRNDSIGRDRLRSIGAQRGSKRGRQRTRGKHIVAGKSAPVVALGGVTAPEAITAAGHRHSERFVVPLREERRVLDRCAEAPALALELCPRIAVEACISERRSEADHDQDHEHFRQGETGGMSAREHALYVHCAAGARVRGGYRSHEPTSASTPVPPGAPSAPKLKTSISPRKPGLKY